MSREYDHLIEAAARKHLPMLDWRLYRALLVTESGLKPDAVSPAGAAGLAQFMPGTWAQWAPKAGYPAADRFNPEASIFTGAMYLRSLYDQWTSPRPEMDRFCLACASYNAGLGNILKAQQIAKMANGYKSIMTALPQVTGDKSKETLAYAPKILRAWVNEVTGA